MDMLITFLIGIIVVGSLFRFAHVVVNSSWKVRAVHKKCGYVHFSSWQYGVCPSCGEPAIDDWDLRVSKQGFFGWRFKT